MSMSGAGLRGGSPRSLAMFYLRLCEGQTLKACAPVKTRSQCGSHFGVPNKHIPSNTTKQAPDCQPLKNKGKSHISQDLPVWWRRRVGIEPT